RVAEDERGDPRHLAALLVERSCAGERRRGADVLEPGRVTGLPDAPGEERDVRALAAAVGVQLVEDEESEPLRRLDDRAVEGPREDVLEHHVVREQDVGRRMEDLVPFLLALLPRVAPEADEVRRPRRTDGEELLELADLA